jgi:hypothetical protein
MAQNTTVILHTEATINLPPESSNVVIHVLGKVREMIENGSNTLVLNDQTEKAFLPIATEIYGVFGNG